MAEENRNPFEELDARLREVPPGMRKKVMHDVAVAKLILEMAYLITANFGSLFSGLFRTGEPDFNQNSTNQSR
ncbi:hypothetical protein [Aureicoccus marinus]|jgi:hypothetical protein|uniref:Uncharacterized protein n=1 Tax=Aureicoccus marinus TaxID=754435 RepID=A0A2S7T7X7_9FLAO|nr:hypothetical protein [Aureicoccus marinus]PQJ15617.1 hypothetical protein BST99_07640 [Aureicoccus marinus]